MNLSETVIRDPVFLWRNAADPQEEPQADPPPRDAGTWEITGSEIRIRPSGTAVHIWYAATPAMPA